MKTIKVGHILLITSTAALWIAAAATGRAQTQTNRLRLGVYDSRAVAVAYANSREHSEAMKPELADYEKAKAAKNDKRVKEIDARMKLKQRRAHEQAFSTGSVAATLAKVKDALPAVAKEAGVQAIVSKWELNYQSPGVEVVDVTDRIVALFHVSDRGLKWTKDIQTKPPLPIEQITDDMD